MRTTSETRYDVGYVRGSRVHSLAHQMETVLALDPHTVLEIGPGPGVLAAAMRALDLEVTTLDRDGTLAPDIVAPVTDIPLADGAFDVAVCRQVLEHLPFAEAAAALRELRRVTHRAAVVSLPDVTRYIKLSIALPRIGRRSVSWSPRRLRPRPIPPQRLREMGHHWEIGFAGVTRRTVERAIEAAGWHLDRTWRVDEVPWHRFFLLRASDRT